MNNEKLEEYKCAFSDEKRFVVKPITLTCRHSVCQKCIPWITLADDNANEKRKEIKCKICDKESKEDLKLSSVSKLAQQALNFAIGDIFNTLEKETSIRLNELKGMQLFILMIIYKFPY